MADTVDMLRETDDLCLDSARFYPDGRAVFVVRRLDAGPKMVWNGTAWINHVDAITVGARIELETTLHDFPNQDFINRVSILL